MLCYVGCGIEGRRLKVHFTHWEMARAALAEFSLEPGDVGSRLPFRNGSPKPDQGVDWMTGAAVMTHHETAAKV